MNPIEKEVATKAIGTYDHDGKLIYAKTTHYDMYGAQSDYTEYTYHYDENNRLIREERTSFDNDGTIIQTDVKEYKDFIKTEQ